MPIPLSMLCAVLNPNTTSLLLGAGSSMPSGAPSGAALADQIWREVAKSEPLSSNLTEASYILERNFGRRPMIDAVVGALAGLAPTGGLLGLPSLGWKNIYSTNFDTLVEQAYRLAGISLQVIKSNFDFQLREANSNCVLYKIHGCITQDKSLGHKASMIITENDYEKYESYRQSLFSSLNCSLLTGDVLIVGQSLADPHLSDMIKRVLKYKEEGAPGQVYILVYDKDNMRAPLWEDKGAKVAFGGLDQFVHEFGGKIEVKPDVVQDQDFAALPIAVVSSVLDVIHASTEKPNTIRMFNGGAASYADIRAGGTFERAQFATCASGLLNSSQIVLALIGAGGVGKTSFARQLALSLIDGGFIGFEHKSDFQFSASHWIMYERLLREKGQRAVLVVDECTRSLRQVNLLVNHLASMPESSLKLILTANAAQWTPRLKDSGVFSRGKVIEISRLATSELNSLLNLLGNDSISSLVQSGFKELPRREQLSRLERKCSADMFVCLKNIFANDSLDKILLTEYEGLEESAKDHYRYIAALEAVGTRVHRQLIMRMLGVPAGAVSSILSNLHGIVDEVPIIEKDGIYGWSTRHVVIARKITEYKFSSVEELNGLFEDIVNNINPAIHTEIQSIRDLCDREFGIGRLGSDEMRRRLYRKIIELVPGERIPRHRLVKELLDVNDLDECEYALREAFETVGHDAPLDRYSVKLIFARAEYTEGISDGDRLALLRKAHQLAKSNAGRHSVDKYSYRTLGDAACRLVERGEPLAILDEAIESMRVACDKILDPEMARELADLERTRQRYGR